MTGEDADVVAFENPVTDGEDDGAAKSAAPADGAAAAIQHDGSWEPRPVKLGRGDSDSVEILTGLDAGERYVAKGGFVLKAQLQKSEFESGHNH